MIKLKDLLFEAAYPRHKHQNARVLKDAGLRIGDKVTINPNKQNEMAFVMGVPDVDNVEQAVKEKWIVIGAMGDEDESKGPRAGRYSRWFSSQKTADWITIWHPAFKNSRFGAKEGLEVVKQWIKKA